MSLTTTEEALVRELLSQQAAILSLAENEATIQSKLGATKVTLSDLTAATSLADTDLLLVRQGTTDKSVTAEKVAEYALADIDAAIAGKADDDEVVKLTGDQTIAGVKTFSSSPIVPNATTAQQAAAFGQIAKQIQPLSATVASNALTLTLGATVLDFRSSTLADGTVNTRTVASPISLVITNGSTLGTVSGQAARIAVIAIDNAGTVELAAVNLAGGNQLDETNRITTIAEGGAGGADSASVIYSATARTNVTYRVVGFIDITEVTAGTWATAPSTIQGVGGQALAAMSSLGYGQTWQDVSGSRVLGTTYYNTTGKPILVAVNTASGAQMTLSVGGVIVGKYSQSTGGIASQLFAAVPSGASYVAAGGIIGNWAELR
jgi:hypothetical protein